MITEIAQLSIKEGEEANFEAAVAQAAPHFQAAKGYISLNLEKCIENPLRYNLVVQWETLDNHMVDFRNSDGFTQWRALAGPFFAEPPQVIHTHNVFKAK